MNIGLKKNVKLQYYNMIRKNIHSLNIIAHARLHMGFFDLHGGLGRKFGSIGVALEWPVTEILATKLGEHAQTTAQTLHQNVNFKMLQTIPSHAGLGSGTQLALAVGAAYNQLYGLGLSAADIALSTNRGSRSGVGIGTFELGGVIVDGGRANHSKSGSGTIKSLTTPPVLARMDFPDAWRILLIMDDTHKGLHGEEELSAFKTLPVFPEQLADKLCRHVLMQALPALHEQDLASFGAAISALQTATGDYFSPVQGGRYASQKVAQVLDFLTSKQVSCLGQSSWGPTGFAVFENESVAQQMLAELRQNGCRYVLTKGCNRPAEFKILQ